MLTTPLHAFTTPSNYTGISLSIKIAFDVELPLISANLKNKVWESQGWRGTDRGGPPSCQHSSGGLLAFLLPASRGRYSAGSSVSSFQVFPVG